MPRKERNLCLDFAHHEATDAIVESQRNQIRNAREIAAAEQNHHRQELTEDPVFVTCNGKQTAGRSVLLAHQDGSAIPGFGTWTARPTALASCCPF